MTGLSSLVAMGVILKDFGVSAAGVDSGYLHIRDVQTK